MAVCLQAWVTAAFQSTLGDEAAISDEAAARVCANQLYLFDSVLKTGDHTGPTIDNAFPVCKDFDPDYDNTIIQ